MLKNSLRSLEETNEDLDFHVLSDRPLTVPYTWIPSLTGKASRLVKTCLFEFTPFELTLFVDTDTVFGETINIEGLLGDADLAMGLDADPKLIDGAKAFLKHADFTSKDEVEETLDLCGPSFPFFNSGVIVWRQTEKVRAFFKRWHSEWLKYKRADQLALARALSGNEIQVRTLPRRFNFPVLSQNLTHDKAIYHLIYKERIAREVGLWEPEFDNLAHPALSEALKKGTRAENQYLHIGQKIYNNPEASSLIVCPNGDEYFWQYCSPENVKFVVEDGDPIEGYNHNKCIYKFDSKVGEWAEHADIPLQINQPFDYVIVNGPKGLESHCPGREIPIIWASKLAKKEIFVFDYNRDWERQICLRHLGKPKYVVSSKGEGDGELAVFEIQAG